MKKCYKKLYEIFSEKSYNGKFPEKKLRLTKSSGRFLIAFPAKQSRFSEVRLLIEFGKEERPLVPRSLFLSVILNLKMPKIGLK